MMKMQIIIPMTGQGLRFQSAGYQRLKPFIKIHEKPMIEWVVKMFPGDLENITFICRQEHLDKLEYVNKELKQIAPGANIISQDNWQKKGPVYDIMKAENIIDDARPVIISYCDYYMHWDYKAFKEDVVDRNCAGAELC